MNRPRQDKNINIQAGGTEARWLINAKLDRKIILKGQIIPNK